MQRQIVGHAIVSVEGKIADRHHRTPPELRSDADWRRFQAALDASSLVVMGRLGHEIHPNPGRRRLVVTSGIDRLEPDPRDAHAMFWNPTGLAFDDVLEQLAIGPGAIAVTGGTRVFDLFLDRFTHFDLAEIDGVAIPDGIACFSSGPPASVLAGAGLHPLETTPLDPRTILTVWSR